MKKFSLAMLALAPVLAAAPAFAAETAAQTTTTATTTTTTAAKTTSAAPGHAQAEAEHRLADLKAKLKITAEQQKAWDDFAATMRENAAHTDQLVEQRKQAGDVTALQSMQAYAAFTQNNSDNVQRLLPKFETLYNDLSADQKKAADNAFAEARKKMLAHAHPG